MKRDTRHFVLRPDDCGRARALNPKHKAEFGLFRVGAPMEQLGIDLLGGGTFPKTRTGFKYILSIIDHFTMWAVAVPMKDQTTETVAQAVLDQLVTTFGVRLRIHSDRGNVRVGVTHPLPATANSENPKDLLSASVRGEYGEV